MFTTVVAAAVLLARVDSQFPAGHDPAIHGRLSWNVGLLSPNWVRHTDKHALGRKDDDDQDIHPPGWEDASLPLLVWTLITIIVILFGCVGCIMLYTERVDAQRLEAERARERRRR